MTKRIILLVFVVSCLCTFSARAYSSGGFCGGCRACLVGDAETGEVIYGKNIDGVYPVGSIVKMMLELIVAEKVKNGELSLDEPVRTSRYASMMGGSQVYLREGEVHTLGKMLEAVAVSSANDAAVAIAEHVSGSVEGFLDLVRFKARELGLKDSVFYTVHGLPDRYGREDLMSPRDIFKVARELVRYDLILKLSSIRVDRFRRNFVLYNTNKLLGRFPGLDGLKTGHTRRAGYCFVATSKRKGIRLIAIVLGCRSERRRFQEAARLLNYGFNLARRVFLVRKGDVVDQLLLKRGNPEVLKVVAGDDFYTYVFSNTNPGFERRIELRPDISPPVRKGEVVGTMSFYREGKLVGSVRLVAGCDVERISYLEYLWRLIFGS